MSVTSAFAIYFIVWWLCLFVVLPFGVKNAHEAGVEVGEGHEAGAPVHAMLWRKALATTVLATVIFAAIYLVITQAWFG